MEVWLCVWHCADHCRLCTLREADTLSCLHMSPLHILPRHRDACVCVFILFNFLLNQHSVTTVTHFGAVLGEKAEMVAYMTQPRSCSLQSVNYLTSHPHSDHTALAAPLSPDDGSD